jgi:hypothetical protein
MGAPRSPSGACVAEIWALSHEAIREACAYLRSYGVVSLSLLLFGDVHTPAVIRGACYSNWACMITMVMAVSNNSAHGAKLKH